MSILPLLLVMLFNMVLPFALNTNFVFNTNSSSVSSVIVAFTVVFLFLVLILSGVISAAFFSSVSVPFVSVR
jgi:hypothetical protein